MINADSLNSLVNRVANRIHSAACPVLEESVLDTLEDHIELAFPLLDILVSTVTTSQDPEESSVHACCLLIGEILNFVQYAIEQERQWADDFSTSFQQYLADTLFVPEIDNTIIQRFLDILHQCELPLIDAIGEANARLAEHTASEGLPKSLPVLLEEIAAVSDTPYDIYENLMPQLHQIVPDEIQILMIDEMLESSLPIVQEAAVLMLLHPNKAIRTQVPHLLSHANHVLTPTNLRRMIVLRSWLPHDERPGVDALIRFARRKGVFCESWPQASVLKVIATGFDGVGAQSLLVLSKDESSHHLTGVLLKENMGVKEPILFHSQPLEACEKIIDEMQSDALAVAVDTHYLDTAIPHFLGLGLQQGQPPSPLLLGFAERAGVSHWHAEAVNETSMFRHLSSSLKADDLEQDVIEETLESSKSWIKDKFFAKSWVEQDAEVDFVLKRLYLQHVKETESISEKIPESLIDAFCQTLLESRRDKWQSRLLWMALWAKASDDNCALAWKEFFIVARLLHDGLPLDVIPLMHAISEETVMQADG